MKIWLPLLLLVTKVSAKNTNETMGPFRTVLTSVRRCQNTTYPLQKDPPLVMNMWTIKSDSRARLLSFNATVLRETKQARLKVKTFKCENGKWKLQYLMNGFSCHGMPLNVFFRAVGFKMFDTSKCAFIKGTFSFDGINPNTILHMFASKMEYGQIFWQCEMNMGFSTLDCWEFMTRVETV